MKGVADLTAESRLLLVVSTSRRGNRSVPRLMSAHQVLGGVDVLQQ